MKYDFSGYATKNDLKCSDGRVIRKDAFKHNDGQTVPLVWQHMHNEPNNILGHALLENRDDGVYAYCKFNDTESGKNAKVLVKHKDISALSIYANSLKQKGSDVLHGAIREVSLVLSGANPGALIDNLAIEHSDGSTETDEKEAIIYTGEEISLEEVEHEDKEKTLQDVFDSLNDDQKDLFYGMLAHALESMDDEEAKHSDEAKKIIKFLDDNTKSIEHQKGGEDMKKNLFDNDNKDKKENELTHSQIQTIFDDAKKSGSLKESVLKHVDEYGITNIDYLFPDAKTVDKTPEFIKRETTWVDGVLNGAKHTPFSRIKSLHADITADEARAKGYVKGSLKKEEVFALLKRTTSPTTIYKKQKLDRDDIHDITDFDVVAWLKGEMRIMLNEEIARASLIGDGRAIDDPDKIDENAIRPIYKDDDFYSHKVKIDAGADVNDIIEAIIRARKNYKGKGRPSFYTTSDLLTDMLLAKDSNGRDLYPSEAELAKKLRVKSIIEVEAMEGYERNDGVDDLDLIGIIVNMSDYTIGADKGGKIGMFDDFDIDYNQYKYLIETRCSGALTRYKTALVIEQKKAAG
jgi:HK97 family phage prohead protease